MRVLKSGDDQGYMSYFLSWPHQYCLRQECVVNYIILSALLSAAPHNQHQRF